MSIGDGVWRLPALTAGTGEREWRFDGGRLRALTIGERSFEASDPRFSRLDLRFDAQGRGFPPAFRYSPLDGSALASRPARILPFAFPSLLPDGFADLGLGAKAPQPDSRAPAVVPSGAVALFAFGRPSLLHALTLQGDLLFRDPAGEWQPQARLAAPSLPAHAHSIAAWTGGFAAVLGDRLVVARTAGDDPELAVASPDLDGWVPVSGPAILAERQIAFPLRQGEALRLAIHDISTGEWRHMAVAGEAPGESVFAAPIQNRSPTPDCAWIGRQGVLLLGSDFGAPVAAYRRHPEGVRTVVGVPPMRERNGTFHALVETEAHFAYLALTREPRIARLSGPHLAAGERSYFGRQVFNSLFDDEPVSLPIEAGSGRVLLPLAWSEDAAGRTEGALLLLVEDADPVADLFVPRGDRTYRATAFWHAGSRLVPLGATLRLRSRFDAILARDGDGLILGSAFASRFNRWDCR